MALKETLAQATKAATKGNGPPAPQGEEGFTPRTEAEKLELEAVQAAARIHAEKRAKYDALWTKHQGLIDRLIRTDHELDLLRRELATTVAERDIYRQKVARFEAHVAVMYGHVRDMHEALVAPPSTKPPIVGVDALKQLESQITGGPPSPPSQA